MPFYYSKTKMRSALNAIQRYIVVQDITRVSFEKTMNEVVATKDLTHAVHQVLYRISSQLTMNLSEENNERIKVRQIGKLRLNQAIYLPTPNELKHAYYSTAEVNHRITGNGVIRRMS